MTREQTQMAVIGEIGDALVAAGIGWWLFGGWGLDALVGRITRAHGDIEVWVAMADGGPARRALEARGFVAVGAQPPEESQEFERRGVGLSTAFFVATADGFAHPEGRWADWRFPPGSLGATTGVLGGRVVPVMSAAGMLAMKTQYAGLRNGKPPRDKDLLDLPVLRALAAA